MPGRLLFDISTSARWIGPPVGIVRVERELAKWAFANDQNCHFVFFDGNSQSYREINRYYLVSVLKGNLSVDTTGMRDPSRLRPRKTERVPRALLTPFLWLTQTRRMAHRSLGTILLKTRSSILRTIVGHIYNFISPQAYRQASLGLKTREHMLVGLDAVAGEPIQLRPDDRILFAGANWAHSNATYVAEQKTQLPVELITLCYDAIPLLFPHYFKPHDVRMLKTHFDVAFSVSSLILVTSRIIAEDIQKYCRARNISIGQVRQVPLGYDLPSHRTPAEIPARARQYSRYILFVSTIEPRKGHRLAQAVWSRLLQENIPQKLNAGLILVGRPGWMVDDLIKSLSACSRIEMLDSVDDQVLAALYANAEFCIYPSEYEGYGLPVVEALAHGKGVLSSNVGFVPELEAQSLQRLPPADENAWYTAMKARLLHPPCIAGKSQFDHPAWQEAAAQVFAAIYEDS